jgi:ribokinase
MRSVSWTVVAAVLLAFSTSVGAASPTRGVVLVVGSINVDVIVPVARLPLRGETATALNASALLAVGGKGANQAVAVARLQPLGQPSPVFVGRLGGDAHEPWLRKSLLDAGVDLSATETVHDTSSGQGLVLLEAGGAATSVVLGGANTEGWPASDVALGELAEAVLSAHVVAVLLLQREVPQRVNTAFAVRAAARHIPVCLDAGGEAGPLVQELAAAVTYLTPNESELARLTGMPTDTEEQVIAAARALRRDGAAGVKHILVTLGERGSMVLFANDTLLLQPAAPLPGGQLVDATAAGDAFRAAFAVGLTEQLPLTASLALASAAGAIAASRLGAMPSLPTRAEVDAHVSTAPAAHSAAPQQTSAESCEPPAALTPRHGADVAAPGGKGYGGDGDDECRLAFASRLNSMAARWDLVDGNVGLTNDVSGWIARQAAVPGLSTVALNYPQHFDDTAAVVAALRGSGLRLDALCLRFPPSFRGGAFTNQDATLRAAALDLAVRACTTAAVLNASHVVYWSPYDGYDLSLIHI